MTRSQKEQEEPPEPFKPPEEHFAINAATRMTGKTVKEVKIGFQKPHPRLHETELIVIYFTDNTAVAITTGSNAQELKDKFKLKPEDVRIDFIPTWYSKVSGQWRYDGILDFGDADENIQKP
jgi:hypothetical protein